jgi:hypothetical protein
MLMLMGFWTSKSAKACERQETLLQNSSDAVWSASRSAKKTRTPRPDGLRWMPTTSFSFDRHITSAISKDKELSLELHQMVALHLQQQEKLEFAF